MQRQSIQTKPQIVTAKTAISCEARNPVEASNEYFKPVCFFSLNIVRQIDDELTPSNSFTISVVNSAIEYL